MNNENPSNAIRDDNRLYMVLMGIILLVAAAYRLYDLTRLSLWADELWGVIACSKGSWTAMVQELITRDNHPPGYQTLLYFVMTWIGDSEWLVRLPSVVAGVLTVQAVNHIGGRIFSKEAGLLAACLVAGSYTSICYSQEARAYILLGLMACWNIYYFLRLFVLEESGSKNLFLFIATGTAMSYIHYAGLMLAAIEYFTLVVLCLFARHRKEFVINALYAVVMMAMLYLKWIPVMIAQVNNPEFYWAKVPTPQSLLETARFLLGPDNLRFAASSILLLFGAWYALRRMVIAGASEVQQKYTLVLVFIMLASVACVYLKSVYSASVYTNRYFVFVIPLASLVIAHALAVLVKRVGDGRRQWQLLLGILFAINAVDLWQNQSLYTATFGKQDFRGAVAMIHEDRDFSADKDLIITSHEFFDYYLQKQALADHAQYYLLFQSQVAGALHRVAVSRAQSFYYLEVSTAEATDINEQLDQKYTRISTRRVTGINVIKYQVPARFI